MSSKPKRSRIAKLVRTSFCVTLMSLFFLTCFGCNANIGTLDENSSPLEDYSLKAGEPSPIDGMVVPYKHYEHMRICESLCGP